MDMYIHVGGRLRNLAIATGVIVMIGNECMIRAQVGVGMNLDRRHPTRHQHQQQRKRSRTPPRASEPGNSIVAEGS